MKGKAKMGEILNCFKGFDKDLKCRDFQYEIGGEYTEENADICNSGFHACESPLEVFSYYAPGSGARYCEVELDANDQKRDDSKRVGKHIKIGAEIGIAGLIKAHFEYVNKRVKESVKKGNSEAATAGLYGAATAGDRGAATAGSYGAATAGDSGAATSRGRSASGNEGLSVARGNNVRVKGGMGAILVIAEEESHSYKIKECKAVVVDGEKIKPDIWYRLEDGEFIECMEDTKDGN